MVYLSSQQRGAFQCPYPVPRTPGDCRARRPPQRSGDAFDGDDLHLESVRDAKQRLQRGHHVSRLQSRYGVLFQPGPLGKLRLRPAGRLASRPNRVTDLTGQRNAAAAARYSGAARLAARLAVISARVLCGSSSCWLGRSRLLRFECRVAAELVLCLANLASCFALVTCLLSTCLVFRKAVNRIADGPALRGNQYVIRGRLVAGDGSALACHTSSKGSVAQQLLDSVHGRAYAPEAGNRQEMRRQELPVSSPVPLTSMEVNLVEV